MASAFGVAVGIKPKHDRRDLPPVPAVCRGIEHAEIEFDVLAIVCSERSARRRCF